MKILETLAKEKFSIVEGRIAGDKVYLIYKRDPGATWSPETIKYRSSIWNEQMQPVSLGFKKFFNLGEEKRSLLFKDPSDSSLMAAGAKIVEKIDGSCLIVSKYKKELIVRTRQSFDASNHFRSGGEIPHLKTKYPKVFNNHILDAESHSLLFEWTTPSNRIVVDYGQISEIRLIGAVNHKDYSYMTQEELDELGKILEVKRPSYLNITSIEQLLDNVKHLTKAEGYCVYFNGGQDIKKIKSDWYLALQKFVINLKIDPIVDFYISYNYPTLSEFKKILEEYFDLEYFPQLSRFAEKICEAYKMVASEIERMKRFVAPLDGSTAIGRKIAATQINIAYGASHKASFVFDLLDNKPLTNRQIRKLIFKSL
jgi:hypothetical protein